MNRYNVGKRQTMSGRLGQLAAVWQVNSVSFSSVPEFRKSSHFRIFLVAHIESQTLD